MKNCVCIDIQYDLCCREMQNFDILKQSSVISILNHSLHLTKYTGDKHISGKNCEYCRARQRSLALGRKRTYIYS